MRFGCDAQTAAAILQLWGELARIQVNPLSVSKGAGRKYWSLWRCYWVTELTNYGSILPWKVLLGDKTFFFLLLTASSPTEGYKLFLIPPHPSFSGAFLRVRVRVRVCDCAREGHLLSLDLTLFICRKKSVNNTTFGVPSSSQSWWI